MLRLWTEDRVDHVGTYFHCHDATLAPRPYQQPHPPLVMATVAEETNARLSPDGRWIAYIGRGIRLIAPDGTGDHALAGPGLKSSVESGPNYAGLEWSPDGKRLALMVGDKVVIVSARTGAVLERLTLANGGVGGPFGLVWRPRVQR